VAKHAVEQGIESAKEKVTNAQKDADAHIASAQAVSRYSTSTDSITEVYGF
jgi:hypothetical protein